MFGGYVGKIGFVNLSNGEIREQELDEKLACDFIGGHGLGARILFEMQKGWVDPLGPDNILGFVTGPLTGTPVPTGGRYAVVCKSPLTGGWGDANSGGFFGPELKFAGLDAIFASGIAPRPSYLLVTDAGIEIKDASHLWGKDTIETEEALAKEIGDPKVRVACIGPASEKLSLISGICNDKGRYAGRSGVGAVMGSKKLKAVVARGKGKINVADSAGVKKLNQEFTQKMKEVGFIQTLMKYGTCGSTVAVVGSGVGPVKNWQLTGTESFPTVEKIGGDNVIAYETKKYGCFSCPIRCGGITTVPSGKYPVSETHKPEYETVAAFGNMCLNDDLDSIFKLNDMCNRSGLDTISAGSVLAFAMECYEHGLITKAETDGIDLTWGNSEAMVAMTEKIGRREGFGDVLADGVMVAAKKIGKGAEKYAMHIGGQEPGLHNATFFPGRGTGFVADPTPGRHTAAAPYTRCDVNASAGPYKELQVSGFEKYQYTGKGPAAAANTNYWQVGASAGLCLMPVVVSDCYPLLEFINAVTGWDMSVSEALKTGARIQTLRQLFNVREGIAPSDVRLPDRMAGIPPQSSGPLEGVTINIDTLTREYREAMEWDPKTGKPSEACLTRLGLKGLMK
ncbi:MAG TPA: aldehyde ferredoxin oxidoreductase family protein [Dehalococcoidales bacterium]|nr:aldehyde ferredoxin oxidoreductase family protein [Dehalococcoidales bacterium]